MDESTFKRRTKLLGLDAIRLATRLRRDPVSDVIRRQLVRAATSVGANYRAACRGQSRADVSSKLAIVEGEADEVLYWLELLIESGLATVKETTSLLTEANEILSMTVASIKTLRGTPIQKSKIQNPKSKMS